MCPAEETYAFYRSISWRGDNSRTEGEVVALRDVLGVLLPSVLLVGKLLLGRTLVGVRLDLCLGRNASTLASDSAATSRL